MLQVARAVAGPGAISKRGMPTPTRAEPDSHRIYNWEKMACFFCNVLLLLDGASARTQALYDAVEQLARTTALLIVFGVSGSLALAIWLFVRSHRNRKAARKREQAFCDSL